jgi:hypothetical protein
VKSKLGHPKIRPIAEPGVSRPSLLQHLFNPSFVNSAEFIVGYLTVYHQLKWLINIQLYEKR